jgi:site-specific recombinase XerC
VIFVIAERERVIVFTSLPAGLRADELIGDIRRADADGVLQVRGKGNKDRRIPFGSDLLDVSTNTFDPVLVASA